MPKYQREYAWGLPEVSAFWEDIAGALDGESYFLGLLIFTNEEGIRHVVDGQQRLLTLTLLADALRRSSAELRRRALSERLESTFLYAMNYESDEVEPRLRLSDEVGNRTLRRVLKEGDPGDIVVSDDTLADDPEATVSERIITSHRYLAKKLREDLSTTDSFKRLGQWSEFLLEKLYFAVFEHPDRNAAYKVFEVVNTRGKDLTTADLVKSYVLSESGSANRSINYDRWLSLTDAFRGGYENQFVQYIRHVVTERHGYVLPSELYRFISANYQKEAGVSRLLDELEMQLATYEQIMDPTASGDQSPRAVQVFAAMEMLGLRNVRPMLLAISKSDDSATGMVELLKLAVRRIVVGNFGTGNVERQFSDAAKTVFDDPNRSWRAGLAQLHALNPSSQDFEKRLAERSFNKEVLKFLRSSILQRTTTPDLSSALHFVRPRVVADWPGFSDEDFRLVGSTLGNTVLSTAERRPSGSNSIAGVNSQLLPTAIAGEVLSDAQTLSIWTSETVREVGARLAAMGARVWYD